MRCSRWSARVELDLIYLLPVILTAARYGLRPGLFGSVIAGLAYNFFFLPPLYTFTIADPQSVLTMFVLIGIAGFVSHLAGRLKARATLSARSATENAQVAAFAQALARSSTWQETASTVCSEVGLLLDCDTLLLAERDGVLTVMAAEPAASPLGPVDQAAAEWCWSRGEPAGRGTATLTAADWQFHPLKTALGTLAVLGLARDDGTDPVPADRTVLLSTLVGQAALAHERLRLENEMRELGLLKERDHLRAALLSSIGHDLRTPLTGVAGAVEALAADLPNAPAVALARAEVQRLKRFLDNLVDMVRIDAGALQLTPEPLDLTDAVSSAVHDLRDALRHNRIDLAIPGTLPLVRADPRLLHHILINLLANATQHGDPEGPISIEARRISGAVLLEVRDRGPGIEPGAETAIFETFARGKGSDRSGDSGLGLAIVKGFADALGIDVRRRPHPMAARCSRCESRRMRWSRHEGRRARGGPCIAGRSPTCRRRRGASPSSPAPTAASAIKPRWRWRVPVRASSSPRATRPEAAPPRRRSAGVPNGGRLISRGSDRWQRSRTR